MKHLPVNPRQRRRAKPLTDFDVPMRRKFPISQPSILKRLEDYNRSRSYDHRIKPFGFVQSVMPAVVGANEPLPIAPYEADLAKSKRLAWVDYNTGRPISLDWHACGMHDTTPVTPLREYVDMYQDHAESKAADSKGDPARPHTIGLLGRLRLKSQRLNRIGKEIDRLDQDDGASLTPDRPVEYELDELGADIDYLAEFPQEPTARDLGLTERGWRNLIKRLSMPRRATAGRIRRIAADRRSIY